MATLAELQDALVNADKAGDKEAARQLADAIVQMRGAQQPAAQAPATLTQKVQASAPMRVVQGMRDPIDAGAQLLPRGLQQVTSAFGFAPNPVSEWFGSEAKRVDKGISDNERDYEAARKATGQDGWDVARVGGNVLSPANLALASKLPVAASTGARVLQGAGLGAAGGALTPVDTEKSPDFATTKGAQVVLGAVSGAVLTPLLGKLTDALKGPVGKIISKFSSGSDDVVLQKSVESVSRDLGLDWGKMNQAERKYMQDLAIQAAKADAGKDPAALLRVQDFKAEEMPYLLGQVTRDPAQFAREKNLAQTPGVGDDILARLQQQGRIIREKIGRFGAGAADEQSGGNALVEALRQYDEKLRGGVTAAYRAARDSAGKDAEVPLQGLAQDFASVVDRYADKVPAGVRNQFLKFGIGGDINAPGGMTQRKVFTVEEADKLLKVINDNQSSDTAVNSALSELRKAVKKAVTSDAGVDDVFSAARKMAADRFKLQDAVPALDAAASGRVNPDTFVQNFILSKNAQTKQVQEMARLLRENNPEAFEQARAQVGAWLQRQAFGENVAGDKALRPEQLAKALRQFGADKLEAFFSPQEVQQLQRLSRIGAYIDSVPNASKPNTSGNWGAITDLAMKVPGLPSGVALVNALRSGVGNQLSASRALSAELPAQLTPQQIEMYSKLLSAGGLGAGVLGAQPLK